MDGHMSNSSAVLVLCAGNCIRRSGVSPECPIIEMMFLGSGWRAAKAQVWWFDTTAQRPDEGHRFYWTIRAQPAAYARGTNARRWPITMPP